MKCFYHSADLDGHCSGAIVKHFHPECELIGWNYGQPIPEIADGECIILADISFPMDEMIQLKNRGVLITWIDHHVSAIKEYERACCAGQCSGGFLGKRDTGKAACELCWEFYSGLPVPLVVETLGVYDSWRFKPDDESFVKKFQYGMRLEKETRPDYALEFWEKLFPLHLSDEGFDRIFWRGAVIYDYQLTQNEKTCRACAFETVLEMGGADVDRLEACPTLKCIAVNSNLMNSDVFRSVWDPQTHDAMLCFYRSKRGFWRCSIYSDKPDVDCSIWAKSYGGGGHKGAAGFRCSELPFELTKMD